VRESCRSKNGDRQKKKPKSKSTHRIVGDHDIYLRASVFAGELITNIIIPGEKKLTIGKHCYHRYYVQCGTRARPPALAHLVYNLFSASRNIQIVSPETQPDLLPVECAACCMRAIVEKFALAANSFPRCSHTEFLSMSFPERNLIVPCTPSLRARAGPFPRLLKAF
jgi:hypothetical protein